MALTELNSLASSFPMDPSSGKAQAVHSTITARSNPIAMLFLEKCGRLDVLTKLEVDPTKWGAADVDLALKIVEAIESTSFFQLGANTIALYTADLEWLPAMTGLHLSYTEAKRDVSAAWNSIEMAINAYKSIANDG